MAIPEKITLLGKVYIKYIDQIGTCQIGDVLLFLNDDAISNNPGDYQNLNVSGYIKAKVYDGKIWQNIDISEFCEHKENRFTKKQRALDSAFLCKAIMEDKSGIILRKTYRAHYTSSEYEPNQYIRKSNRNRK